MTPKDWNKMKKLLGDRADQVTLETVKALVEGIETNLKGSLTANVVKSVQRGVFSAPYAQGSSVELTISEVNPDKCSVKIYGASSYYYVTMLTAMKLTVKSGSTTTSSAVFTASYEIIEYY